MNPLSTSEVDKWGVGDPYGGENSVVAYLAGCSVGISESPHTGRACSVNTVSEMILGVWPYLSVFVGISHTTESIPEGSSFDVYYESPSPRVVGDLPDGRTSFRYLGHDQNGTSLSRWIWGAHTKYGLCPRIRERSVSAEYCLCPALYRWLPLEFQASMYLPSWGLSPFSSWLSGRCSLVSPRRTSRSRAASSSEEAFCDYGEMEIGRYPLNPDPHEWWHLHQERFGFYGGTEIYAWRNGGGG